MWPEVAQICLILAMLVAVLHAGFSLYGASNESSGYMALARPGVVVQWGLILAAYIMLTYGFVVHDFSVKYVASHSNLQQPLIYRISGVWGSHEGSLLLWILMQSSWALLVAMFSKNIPDHFVSRVLAVMSLINIGFISFMLFTSNPFDRLAVTPADGVELNPLLQDPGLAIHPPMLYVGYVGFSVAFAFAVAALLSKQFDTTWAKWTRPWTSAAWLFLTAGITLGSWWAYYELGWGGWWFWDPVENASFMPWLVGTALIHSLAVTEKRGTLIAWTFLLAISAFSLSLLGTFLVRSGILTSVHAFASDPERGLYILGFLVAVIGSALFLYGMRISEVRQSYPLKAFSRETLMLLNVIFLVAATFMVLLGTLFPLLLEALGQGKISVGAPYFDKMFILMTAPLAIVVGIGAMSKWNGDSLSRFKQPAAIWLIASLVLSGAITAWLSDGFEIIGFLGLSLAFWVGLWTLYGVQQRFKQVGSITKIPAGFWGMSLAHFGIAIFILGVTHVSTYSQEKNLVMTPGQEYQLKGYDIRFNGVARVEGENYLADEGQFDVEQDGDSLFVLRPQKRTYSSGGNPMTEAAIDTDLTRDVYISLGEAIPEKGEQAWTVRVYYKSYVACIWLGGFVMALGGIFAMCDKRYRRQAA